MMEENRDTLIDDCVTMRAELEGVDEFIIDRRQYEALTDEQLEREHQWLYEMVYLK